MVASAFFLILIPLLVIAVLAGIGLILFFVLRPRRQSGLGPRAGLSGTPPEGTWNASLHEGSFGATTGSDGIFDVRGGVLSFFVTGSAEPLWGYRCTQLVVRVGSGFGLNPVTLFTPAGEVPCTVSEETINRFARNTGKSGRQTGYGYDFARVLVANGARQV